MGEARVLKVAVRREKVIRAVERRIVGINTNYISDHAEARKQGQGLLKALKQMGVKCLRYPGGEKSDSFLWSLPPYKKPKPSLARIGGQPGYEWPSPIKDKVRNFRHFIHRPMDFDEFMGLCRETGSEPVLCVAFDCMYKPAPKGGWRADKKLLLRNAVEWVRYANVKKGYGVRYWELGNESYLNTYNGGAYAADYARDLAEFSKAMKKVDPSILIGANGPHWKGGCGQLDRAHGTIWWKTVLEASAPDIDFLVVHPYPCWEWGSYDFYRKRPQDLDFTEAARGAREALKSWAPKHAKRIRLAATELNAFDWTSGGWRSLNNLGHALVLFDIIAEHLLIKELDHAAVWNTRYTKDFVPSQCDAVNKKNELYPSGKILEIFGRFLKDQMVEAKAPHPLKAFASTGFDGSATLFVINRELRPQKAALPKGKVLKRWCYSGKDPNDFKPVFKGLPVPAGAQATLPGLSLNIFEYAPQ